LLSDKLHEEEAAFVSVTEEKKLFKELSRVQVGIDEAVEL
jgi:hypothetical protein